MQQRVRQPTMVRGRFPVLLQEFQAKMWIAGVQKRTLEGDNAPANRMGLLQIQAILQ